MDRRNVLLSIVVVGGGLTGSHTHTVEEGHVVLSGRVTYVIGERQVTAEGPSTARVPAGVAHTTIANAVATTTAVPRPSNRRSPGA